MSAISSRNTASNGTFPLVALRGVAAGGDGRDGSLYFANISAVKL